MAKPRLPVVATKCMIEGRPFRSSTIMAGAMLTRVLSMWLAIAVVICPNVCSAGLLCDSTDHSSPATCCSHRGSGSDGSQERRSQDPTDTDSGKICQCVCGGAVVEKVAELDAFAHVASLFGMPVPELLVSAGVSGGVAAYYPTAMQSSMNPGRGFCCLYSSFLC
jgi:hypothetical protein